MRILLLLIIPVLFFACNNAKEEAAIRQLQDSLRIQQKQIDSLKYATMDEHKKKAIHDSLRKIKLTYWKKQATLMSTSLSADKATLNRAKQTHKNRSPERRKKGNKGSGHSTGTG